ncbi:MAG: hypothetical protein J6F30_12250 [Cellulosilyticum sp.]|nr:hypothetical protein [Cellulosilyticum sp.]
MKEIFFKVSKVWMVIFLVLVGVVIYFGKTEQLKSTNFPDLLSVSFLVGLVGTLVCGVIAASLRIVEEIKERKIINLLSEVAIAIVAWILIFWYKGESVGSDTFVIRVLLMVISFKAIHYYIPTKE